MGGQTALANLLPIALMLAAVWFLLIRPQQQRQKKQAEMVAKLEAGTDIVTVGGIFGRIVKAGDERLLIEVADGSRLEIARRSVGSIVSDGDDQAEVGIEELAEPDEADKSEVEY